MKSKVHIIRWVSDPVRALPAEPLIFTVCNWQHEPGEDWSASLSVRYHDHAEIAVELCIGGIKRRIEQLRHARLHPIGQAACHDDFWAGEGGALFHDPPMGRASPPVND